MIFSSSTMKKCRNPINISEFVREVKKQLLCCRLRNKNRIKQKCKSYWEKVKAMATGSGWMTPMTEIQHMHGEGYPFFSLEEMTEIDALSFFLFFNFILLYFVDFFVSSHVSRTVKEERILLNFVSSRNGP